MKITSLECNGVRSLADAVFTLADATGLPLPVVAVTGPPAAGVTTFLEAIAFSAARMSSGSFVPDAADVLRAGGMAATLRSAWFLTPDEQAFGGMTEETTLAEVTFQRGGLGGAEADPGLLGLMSRYDHDPRTSKVVYLPARRLNDSAFSPFGSFEAEMRTGHLQITSNKFAGLARALIQPVITSGDRARFEDVQRLFAEICDTVKLVGVASTGEPEFALPGAARLPLSRLAFSERNAFVFAASFVVMGLATSVVLLDTPEVGLAVEGAARTIAALRAYAPGAQLVLGTRDPVLLASLGSAAQIHLPRGAR